MNRAVTANTPATRALVRISPARLGDAALAAIWVLLSFGSLSVTIQDASKVSFLETSHHVVSSLILCLTAVLFIVRRPASRTTGSWLSRAIAIIGSWLMPALILLPLTWTPDWLLGLTTAVLVVLHIVVFWALLTLRRSFSVFPEARALVRKGPYGVVRHPLYATYMAMYPCFLLPRIGVLAVIVTILGIACEIWRARDEEAILASAFPEYEEYSRLTPRFVPRVSN